MQQQRSIHIQCTNNTKLVEEDILNKLLRPPIKKENKIEQKKYHQQFEKPDIEKLIQQNNLLKQQILQNKKNVIDLKYKNRELQKKIEKLEENQSEQLGDALEGNKKHNSAHTQILKKKIHELYTKYIAAQNQIKKLKKLPNCSIYDENNIEKQHLLAETIRLKAMLATQQRQNNTVDSMDNQMNSSKFHQQFLKILKQQNEKLKATIRLLENDKVLMKARQNNQNKFSNDLRKQIQGIKVKLVSKQAEIEKLVHENQNLLFKKAIKFRFDKEQKQNKVIAELTKTIEQLCSEKKKVGDENESLMTDNIHLKEKQKIKNMELIEKQQELQKIKIQIAEMKNEYETRIKSLQMNNVNMKDSNYQIKISGQHFGIHHIENVHKKNNCLLSEKKKQFNWGKPVKYEELDLCILKIWTLQYQNLIQKYEDILTTNTKQMTKLNNTHSVIRFEEAYYLFKSGLLNLSAENSLKLAKYIFSDHSHIVQGNKVVQAVIQYSLASTIIRATVSKFTECLKNRMVINSWKCFLSKARKFLKQLQQINSQLISKDQFVQILLKNTTSSLQRDQLNFIFLHCFSLQHSLQQIQLNKKKLIQCMNTLIGDSRPDSPAFAQNSVGCTSHKNINKNSINSHDNKSKNSSQHTQSFQLHPSKNYFNNQNNQMTSQPQQLYELKDIGLSQSEDEEHTQEGEISNDSLKQLNIEKVQSQSEELKQFEKEVNQENSQREILSKNNNKKDQVQVILTTQQVEQHQSQSQLFYSRNSPF